MAVCAHDVCTCEVPQEGEFCSDFCAGNANAAECHCHHGSCEAPHHH